MSCGFPDTHSTRKGGAHDARHARERRERARRHKPSDPCARCGHELGPLTSDIHLDHDEHGGYLGFSHGWAPCPVCGRKCNIAAGAAKGRATQHHPQGHRQSRAWL